MYDILSICRKHHGKSHEKHKSARASGWDHLQSKSCADFNREENDKVVFKCVIFVAEDLREGAQVVVYRSKYLEK
jgi:hypothetical protein